MLALADAAFLDALARTSATRVGGFAARRRARRAFPLALEFARARRRPRACVADRQRRADAASGRRPGLQPRACATRSSWRRSIARHAARRDRRRARCSPPTRAARAPTAGAGIAFTHGLVQLFGNDRPLLRWPRGLALTLLDVAAAARSARSRARCCSACAERAVRGARALHVVAARARRAASARCARRRARESRYNPLPSQHSHRLSTRYRRAHRPLRICRTTSPSRRWRASPIARSASCASGWARATRCPRWSRRIRGCGAPTKSRRRIDHAGEVEPIAVQIAGADPATDGRRRALQRRPRRADHRHQHGLPGEEGLQRRGGLGAARRRGAGRARSSTRSSRAVDVPVTLKIRTGPRSGAPQRACAIARIAEDAGIAALAVHGRTRACAFAGAVEYDTIARGQGGGRASR